MGQVVVVRLQLQHPLVAAGIVTRGALARAHPAADLTTDAAAVAAPQSLLLAAEACTET
jgi:hypothetical protein